MNFDGFSFGLILQILLQIAAFYDIMNPIKYSDGGRK